MKTIIIIIKINNTSYRINYIQLYAICATGKNNAINSCSLLTVSLIISFSDRLIVTIKYNNYYFFKNDWNGVSEKITS